MSLDTSFVTEQLTRIARLAGDVERPLAEVAGEVADADARLKVQAAMKALRAARRDVLTAAEALIDARGLFDGA